MARDGCEDGMDVRMAWIAWETTRTRVDSIGKQLELEWMDGWETTRTRVDGWMGNN